MYVIGSVWDYRCMPSVKVAEEVIKVESKEEADEIGEALVKILDARFRRINHGTSVICSQYSDPYDARHHGAIEVYSDCM